MSGALWALIAGVGFGLFQTVNRRAVLEMDAYLATFLQLLVSALLLGLGTLLTVDLSVIRTAPASAWGYFSLAGFFHFFVGWTLLNNSQKKIGASRTSPLIGTTPLFGAVVGALFFDEFLDGISITGIALIVFGVYLVTKPANHGDGQKEHIGLRGSLWGLGASLAWAISPIFIRKGLAVVGIPLLGVTVGMLASAAAYTLPLFVRRRQNLLGHTTKDAYTFKIVAGILVGFSTWARWIALDLTGVAIVLAVTMVSTPLVLLISPLMMGKHIERVTPVLVTGAGLVMSGALLLVLIT